MPTSDQIKSALPDDAVGQAEINQLRAWPYFTALHLIFSALSNLSRFLRTKRQEALNHVLVEKLTQCLNKALYIVPQQKSEQNKAEKL